MYRARIGTALSAAFFKNMISEMYSVLINSQWNDNLIRIWSVFLAKVSFFDRLLVVVRRHSLWCSRYWLDCVRRWLVGCKYFVPSEFFSYKKKLCFWDTDYYAVVTCRTEYNLRMHLHILSHLDSQFFIEMICRAKYMPGHPTRIFNNYSSSPNGLWVNRPWGRKPNGLLTQRPWGREE